MVDLGEARHLFKRFVWSVRPTRLDADDERELLACLNPAEAGLYSAMSVTDRAHAVDCARRVRVLLGAEATDEVVVASALHDVGKTEAALGTAGRVAATIAAAVLGHRRVRAWAAAPSGRGRLGRYAAHPVRGAELLAAAGSSDLAVTWALEHHRESRESTISGPILAALIEADNDVS